SVFPTVVWHRLKQAANGAVESAAGELQPVARLEPSVGVDPAGDSQGRKDRRHELSQFVNNRVCELEQSSQWRTAVGWACAALLLATIMASAFLGWSIWNR